MTRSLRIVSALVSRRRMIGDESWSGMEVAMLAVVDQRTRDCTAGERVRRLVVVVEVGESPLRRLSVEVACPVLVGQGSSLHSGGDTAALADQKSKNVVVWAGLSSGMCLAHSHTAVVGRNRTLQRQ